MELTLRRATLSDLLTVFEWVNDPVVRQLSFSSEPISLETHKNWFTKEINSPASIYLILWADEKPVGQIRFDISVNEYLINFGIAAEFRGKGLGTAILRLGEEHLHDQSKPLSLIGYVKKENIPSVLAFQRNGYRQSNADEQIHPNSFLFKKLIN